MEHGHWIWVLMVTESRMSTMTTLSIWETVRTMTTLSNTKIVFAEDRILSEEIGGDGSGHRAGCAFQPLFGAIERLINLLAEPERIPVLSPLVEKEIVFRLLTTECRRSGRSQPGAAISTRSLE